MTDFNSTNWAKSKFARGYRENADIFIMERRLMLAILQSFYANFVQNGSQRSVLDLGCGDGIVTSAITQIDNRISATLVDGSRDMLSRARTRLNGLKRTRYIHASFQEMLLRDLVQGPFDFVASSLAIHHLTFPEKLSLFERIYKLLKPGGYFVNIDVVLAPAAGLEQWYLALWKDWIDERRWDLGIEDRGLTNVIAQYKKAEENKPDTLGKQIDALTDIGFRDADCFYKQGIFTVYGAKKPDRTDRKENSVRPV